MVGLAAHLELGGKGIEEGGTGLLHACIQPGIRDGDSEYVLACGVGHVLQLWALACVRKQLTQRRRTPCTICFCLEQVILSSV